MTLPLSLPSPPLLLLAALLVDPAGVAAESSLPNILHILLDDFGWADAGWHRPAGYTDVQTPNMNSLVREGVELDRHYVFQFCSPTRSAMQVCTPLDCACRQRFTCTCVLRVAARSPDATPSM
jgi:hypothetical protein